jgi:histidinol-phosphate phosphatase family protein
MRLPGAGIAIAARVGHSDRMNRAVFIDRDGTLNRMVYDQTHGLLDSPRRPEQVRLIEGAGAFLKAVREAGWLAIVVTNQPGIAKGTLTFDELDAVNARLAELLAVEGGGWDALYACPHHPARDPAGRAEYQVGCDCRKPKPGLLIRAAREHDIDLAASWMVGDGLNDVQAGRAAGCRTALVTRLKMEQVEAFMALDGAIPDAFASNPAAAAAVILGEIGIASGAKSRRTKSQRSGRPPQSA